MKSNKTTNQCIRQIALADMEPESGYQRATNPVQVENIVNKFDETKLGTITVSERDGKYHVIDGAHRVKALRRLDYTHAYCVVLTGLTFEDEAEHFRGQNDDKRGIKPMEFFKSGLVSGNEKCESIYRIVRDNGFEIGTDNMDFRKIGSVKALFTITDDYGYEILDDTLRLLKLTWNGFVKASQAEVLLGLAEFVSVYGTIDFAERMEDKFTEVFYDYTQTARTRVTHTIASRRKFCRVLVNHYNMGLANRSKKKLVWED